MGVGRPKVNLKKSSYAIIAFLVVIFGYQIFSIKASKEGTFTNPPLPYEKKALEPYISERTVDFHYDKHTKGYYDNLNAIMLEKNLKFTTLEDVINRSAHDAALTPLFNNAAQAWNHSFYWQSMKKGGGGQPKGQLLEKIIQQFGSYDDFKKQFIETGAKLFGSGWVWLVLDGQQLKIIPTSNADLPLIHQQKPLLVCDVWEHAYYLDYQNERKDYVKLFLDHLVNWEFAENNFAK
jgi:Fe-Mn family superoxide dismutase